MFPRVQSNSKKMSAMILNDSQQFVTRIPNRLSRVMDFCHTKYIKHSLRFAPLASLRYATIPPRNNPIACQKDVPLTTEILSPVRKTSPPCIDRRPVSEAGKTPFFDGFSGFLQLGVVGETSNIAYVTFAVHTFAGKKRIFQIGSVLFFRISHIHTHKHTHKLRQRQILI